MPKNLQNKIKHIELRVLKAATFNLKSLEMYTWQNNFEIFSLLLSLEFQFTNSDLRFYLINNICMTGRKSKDLPTVWNLNKISPTVLEL
jgi:hypothetical protein